MPNPPSPTLCTEIVPGAGFSFVITSLSNLTECGNQATAFITGQCATGLASTVWKEVAEFQASGVGKGIAAAFFDVRWVDDDATKAHMAEGEDDGENLTIVSPWGVYPASAGAAPGIAMFLQSEPSPADLQVLMERAIIYFRRIGLPAEALTFRVVRQVVTVHESAALAPPNVPPAAKAPKGRRLRRATTA